MNQKLAEMLNRYMNEVPEVKDYCQRCLDTVRWDGNVVVMVVDAAFTSIGLNYFQSVVPNVEMFRNRFIDINKILDFSDLLKTDIKELQKVWKNKRSWSMAMGIADHLSSVAREYNETDKNAFIRWARNASLIKWQQDPIGSIKGVGINTFQYLRMMGGVDTVMPDKIVKRVINGILLKAGEAIPASDMDFINTMDYLGSEYGYRPIELCWMTWLIQSESNLSRMHKYSNILSKI
jgi:hypothetical protein